MSSTASDPRFTRGADGPGPDWPPSSPNPTSTITVADGDGHGGWHPTKPSKCDYANLLIVLLITIWLVGLFRRRRRSGR